jgi:hypothetical protein
MVFSENTLKWVTRLYPPLLFQRIWVKKFDKDFRGVEVRIAKSLLNANYNKSIFGGTIFSASDPFYAVLFDQILQRKGFKVRVWLKSAQISYLKPGRTPLHFSINLSEEEVNEACEALSTVGKFIKSYQIEIYNTEGKVCALVTNEIYIRNLFMGEDHTIAY